MRCKCGSAVFGEGKKTEEGIKEPEKYKCPTCGRKGVWGEKFEAPRPPETVEDFKMENEFPPPVFVDGKAYLVVDNQRVPYDEAKIKILERKIRLYTKEIEKLTNKK